MILKVLIFAGVFALDMVSKALLDYKNIPLIDGVISFSYVHNTGAAWGIFGNSTWLLAIFSLIFVIAFIYFDRKLKIENTLYKISFALVLAGTIGNMVDRVILGYVRDFIYLDFLKTFPVFNVADMSLVIGMILLAIYIIFLHKPAKKEASNE